MTFETVKIGTATLYRGDCMEVLPTLGRFDAVITDPPYGIELGSTSGAGFASKNHAHGLKLDAYEGFADTYEQFVCEVVPALNLAISNAERAAIFTGQHIHEQAKPDAIGGIYCPAAAGRHCWGFKTFIPLLLYGKAPDLHKGSKPTCLVSNEKVDKLSIGHPVPKPLGWMLWTVDLVSRKTESILDPFMGSGTTGVAAIQLGRTFTGIEREPKYFDIACKRIEQAYAQGQLFEPVQPVQVQESLI